MTDALPYHRQAELLDDQIAAVRARLRAAKEPSSDGVRWPSSVAERELHIDQRVAATPADTLPIERVRSCFDLSPSEMCIIWTLIAHELCPISRSVIRDFNSEHVADPTTDSIRRIVYGASAAERIGWRELGEQGALRRFALIVRTDGVSDAPLHRQTWKVSDRVLALAHGEQELDPKLASIASIATPAGPLDSLVLANGAARRIRDAVETDGIVLVHGRVGSGRRSAMVACMADDGRAVLEVDSRALSTDRTAISAELRSLSRECRLLAATPLFRELDTLTAGGELADRIALIEAEFGGLVLGTATRPIARRWRRPIATVELAPISAAQRSALWARAIPSMPHEDAATLATMYPLAPALIAAAGTITTRHSGGADVRPEHIAASLRTILDDKLAGLATRVNTTHTWDDVVLPEDQLVALVELMARIRERSTVYEDWGFAAKVGRGLGVSALFSGPPGTGKTMTAGLIAKELGVELYQVDISKIVSKWIGETEKNLAALFDAAEAGHAIILFDEADSLFGKRTDVRSSNDRYANQEVNFLLQRLESYSGIVILTTNHETAIDDAFRRRLSLHMQFPMPERDERARLWQALIPKVAPTMGDLRLQKLADQFEMSGGYIRNAVLRAAFLAASEHNPISSGHLMKAAHLEYEAMGKITNRM